MSLDITSTFPHNAFIEVCKAYGFDDNSINLLRAMLSNITQQVKVGNHLSDSIKISNRILPNQCS